MEHIRDRGNTPDIAARIQAVVRHLGQMSARPVLPHHDIKPEPDIAGRDVSGYCSEGNYHDPSLRLER